MPISAEPTRKERQQGTSFSASAPLPGKGSSSPHLFYSANAPGYRPTTWRRREVGGIKLSVTDKKMLSARTLSALFCQRDDRKGGGETQSTSNVFHCRTYVSERGSASSPYSTQHKKSAESDSAVREENQGTRKPREQQKTNKMHDCA